METGTVDRRVRRTRRMLQEAVIALAERHDPGLIPVQEIAERADVSRATFYQHYPDREALLNETFDNLLVELTVECGPVIKGDDGLEPDVVPPSVVTMLEEIRRRAALYRRLLDPGGSSAFVARFQEHNERLFLEAWRSRGADTAMGGAPPELRARYASAAMTGVVRWWLECEAPASGEELAAWLWDLARPAWFGATRVAIADQG